MKTFYKILLATAICVMGLSCAQYCHRPQREDADRAGSVRDTVRYYDTILYVEPAPKAELAMGTRSYTLPRYFIGKGAGGEPRQRGEESHSHDDPMIAGTSFGTGARGEPRSSGDSMAVELPMLQRHYADSTYEAWVSGPVDPRLDSIKVYAPTAIITERQFAGEKNPPGKWHIGPTIGYGYTPQGLQPYIGVSLTYSILSF